MVSDSMAKKNVRQPEPHLPVPQENDHVHIVLVEPQQSSNIGAVARAMENFGFSKLHLVAPRDFDAEKAKAAACWATDVLNSVKFHRDLEEALSPMHNVVGFSSSHGKNRREPILLPDWTSQLSISTSSELALVFGPEDTGLQNKHLQHCRSLVRLPSTAKNPSFNLAQAVLLVLNELSRRSGDLIPREQLREMATWSDLYQLDQLVTSVAKESGFESETTSEAIPRILKNLFRRIHPDKREVNILLGLFSRIEKSLKQ